VPVREPLKTGTPKNVRFPENVGAPVKVPASEPPPLRAIVPENVSLPLNVQFAFKRQSVAPLVPVLSKAAVPNAVPFDLVIVSAPPAASVPSPETVSNAGGALV
jgi:hypothetical protein